MTSHTTFKCAGCGARFPATQVWQRTLHGRWYPLLARLAQGRSASTSQGHLFVLVCSPACLVRAPVRTLTDWRTHFAVLEEGARP